MTSFVNVLAFGDDADRLAKLGKGDAVSVQGSLKQTQYETNGETRHGLEILVNGILSVHDKRKRANGNDQPSRSSGSDRHDRHDRQSTAGSDWNDDIGF